MHSSLAYRSATFWLLPAAYVLAAASSVPAQPLSTPPGKPGDAAKPADPCAGGLCPAAISNATYQGHHAYKLTDGRSEALVVPALGRIMGFGLVKGPNLLWNAAPAQISGGGGWKNFGGDKTWLAPQNSWGLWRGKGGVWPPDENIDGQKGSKAEVLTGGRLRLTFPISSGTGIRVVREMYFDQGGEFVIEQSATKMQGPAVRASIWSIAQVVPGDALFVPINANSAYKKNFHWLMKPKDEFAAEAATPTLLRIKPQPQGGGVKLGVDTNVSALVSVRDQVAFLVKSNRPKGDYPDGADAGAGFPLEAYFSGDPRFYYMELEILSPLKDYRIGTRWKHTVRWSLHALPSPDVNAPETVHAVEELLSGADKRPTSLE